MVRAALLATAAVLALPITAQATITAPPRYLQWAEASYAPIPPVPVMILEYASESELVSVCQRAAKGCADCDDPTICVVPLAAHTGQDRWDFFHELGHVWDARLMTEGERDHFKAMIHQPASPWRYAVETPGEEMFGSHSPNEWFAEAFALCSVMRHVARNESYNIIGGVLSWRTVRATCRMIGRTRF